MARIRTIKPDFFSSLTIAALPLEARLTFIGLWTHVDDEGRCVDDARLVKAALWPLDDRTAANVETDLQALSEASLITRYTVDGRAYLQVRGWDEHQRINRPTPSRLPTSEEADNDQLDTPDEDSVTAHVPLTEDSRGEGKGREQGTGKGTGKSGAADATRERPPDPLTTAVADTCGIAVAELTTSGRSSLNAAVADLRTAGATPEQVPRRAAVYRQRWDKPLTPHALAKHWASLEPGREPGAVDLEQRRLAGALERGRMLADGGLSRGDALSRIGDEYPGRPELAAAAVEAYDDAMSAEVHA
jgi:hypothetical protein